MPLAILTKSSILDVWPGSKNATKSSNKGFSEFNIFSFSSHLVKYFFSIYFANFYIFQYSKTTSSFVVQVIFIQRNIYVEHTQVCKFLIVTRTKQWCVIVSKEIFIILIWRNMNMFNFFISKWKRIKSSFFVKYAVILIWPFKKDHFKMIVYFSLKRIKLQYMNFQIQSIFWFSKHH